MSNKLVSLIDTLNLILIPKMDIDSDYHTIVNSNLEELEGDCYTFLHENNLSDLLSQKLINQESQDLINDIRTCINDLNKKYWNSSSFLHDVEWNEIRKNVVKVLDSINQIIKSPSS
jgi:hypothetical protein